MNITKDMALVEWKTTKYIQSLEVIEDSGTITETMFLELHDTSSSSSSSPPSFGTTKTGAKRGRPRLTEDAELAKQVFSRLSTSS